MPNTKSSWVVAVIVLSTTSCSTGGEVAATQQMSPADSCIVDKVGERTKAELDCIFFQKLPNILRQLGSTNDNIRRLSGNIVVGATVLPTGQANRSWVVSSDINNSLIESLIADAVKSVDFGAKGSHDVDIQYAIRFVNGVPTIGK